MKLKELLEKVEQLPWPKSEPVSCSEWPERTIIKGKLHLTITSPYDTCDSMMKPTADLIVHAVNMLPKLVEALEKCMPSPVSDLTTERLLSLIEEANNPNQ